MISLVASLVTVLFLHRRSVVPELCSSFPLSSSVIFLFKVEVFLFVLFFSRGGGGITERKDM